jgi:hypothetical protein
VRISGFLGVDKVTPALMFIVRMACTRSNKQANTLVAAILANKAKALLGKLKRGK